MIRVILFDFYGLFLPDAYSVWLASNNLSRDGIFAELIYRHDKGEVDTEQFLDELSSAVGRKVLAGEIYSPNRELELELVELVRSLRPKFSIGLFSNASKGLRQKLETLNIISLFDTIIISSEIGYTKPTSESFAIAIERLGVAANEILFIDDNPRNIEEASRAGIQSLLYISPTNLRADLERYQIL